MKTIVCYGQSESLYHLFKIKDQKFTPENGLIRESGTAIITGFHKGEISNGDKINLSPQGADYIITEIIERRNHAGIFKNPEDKKDSFFKVNTVYSFVRPK